MSEPNREANTPPALKKPARTHSATRPKKVDRSAAQMEVRKLLPGQRFISRVLFVIFALLMVWVAYLALPAFILFFAAIVLAVVFHGCSRLLARVAPGGRALALPLVIAAFVGLFIAAFLYLTPRVAGQIEQVLAAAPDAYERFAQSRLGTALLGTGEETEAVDENGSAPIPFGVSMLGKAAIWATTAIGMVSSLALVFVVAIFIATNPRNLRDGLISLFPVSLRPRAGQVVDEAAHALWRWTIAQGFSMAVIGSLTTVVYMAIGLDYALTLGLIAGLFQFIPYLGPALAAVPALLVAFSMSAQMTLWAAIGYVAIQSLEGNFITPIIMKREAYLPPVLSIMSTVVFGLLFGLAGAALATPLVIVFLTLYRNVYQEDILGVEAPNGEP